MQIALAQRVDRQAIDKLCQDCSLGDKKACTKLTKIALKDADFLWRELAVLCISDQEILTQIAVFDKEKVVRQVAVAKISDPAVLNSIALNDRDHSVREDAVKKVTDIQTLIQIAQLDPDNEVRKIAISKINNEALLKQLYGLVASEYKYTVLKAITDTIFLSSIAADNKIDYGERCLAIQGIGDQSVLSVLATRDESEAVRAAATGRLSDSKILSMVALHDPSTKVKCAALEKISDQELLKEVVRNAGSKEIKRAAVTHLHDQSTLYEVIKNDGDFELQQNIIKNITNDSILYKIIKGTQYSDMIREGAIRKIGNQTMVASLYNDLSLDSKFHLLMLHADKSIRAHYPSLGITYTLHDITSANYEASHKVSSSDYSVMIQNGDNTIFKKVFKGQRGAELEFFKVNQSSKEYIGRVEMDTICDAMLQPYSQDDLKDVVANSVISDLRLAAMRLLKDEAMLVKLEKNDSDPAVRNAAIHAITDQKTLISLFNTETRTTEQLAIIDHLTDLPFLKKIADSGQDKRFRDAAINRIRILSK